MRRRWLGLAGVALACLLLAAPAFGQGRGAGGGKSQKAAVGPIEVVLDGQVKKTWSPGELQRVTTVDWKNIRGTVHKAIPLWTLITEAGVTRESVKGIEVRSKGRKGFVLKEEELARADRLVLRSGRGAIDRPLRLVPADLKEDPSVKGGALIPGAVVRIEVRTAGGAASAPAGSAGEAAKAGGGTQTTAPKQ